MPVEELLQRTAKTIEAITADLSLEEPFAIDTSRISKPISLTMAIKTVTIMCMPVIFFLNIAYLINLMSLTTGIIIQQKPLIKLNEDGWQFQPSEYEFVKIFPEKIQGIDGKNEYIL